MNIRVVGTGSRGNTYLLNAESETLVLDAGMPFKTVKIAMGFDVARISGVLISHMHGDHAKYAREYEKAGIPVIRSYEAEGYGAESLTEHHRLGGFDVMSFPCIHDAPCVGYRIHHPEMGKMVYATDTEYVKYRFRDTSVILIEANWSEEYVNKDDPRWGHILTGHMSLQTALDCIKSNDNPMLKNVILCHLSELNASPKDFKAAAEAVVGDKVRVDIAEKGKVIELGG